MSFPVTDGIETVMPPPPGWVVNFANPTRDENTARQAFWITGFELFIATGFLAQRLYTKLFIVKKIQIDDYLLILAYIGAVGAQAILLQAFRVGLLGTHAWELSVDEYNQSSQMVLATTLTYIPTTILSKLVLCFFYYRLSPVLMYQYAVYFTAFICAGGLGAIWFSVLFACKPIAATWDVRLSAEATCVNTPAIYIIQAALGCITDLMLLLLPIPTVIGLHLSIRHKVGLVGMFAIGSVTLVTSVVRLVLLLPGLGNKDQPWALAEGCLWVNVESNLLIMCGSLPTLKIFLNHVAPRILKDRSKKESSGPGSSSNYNLRTFGQGSITPRRKFDTLVELEHDQFDRSQFRPTETGQTDVVIHGGQADKASVNSRVKGDADSEEAILQVRTTTVAFSKR
ncbi:hypothetical protein F4821DRAFT_221985 [Hypoxylon rubiginosum]|uniref:Uncharacterized protein n=1 Tax=Hypoxylon rubiginosum TaxID=110542 RepID=A0ACC0DLG8_9PEZI|nr:hypothetical protein F4821DRAFT_221985 [Hypoxylon rubiginosum]